MQQDGEYLLLLDMNGTVCYRTEAPVRGCKEDLYVRRKFFYKRIGIERFVGALVDSGHFKVVVYSSMMRHNIEAGLNALLPRKRFTIMDRDMNKPDPDGVNEWDTVRDMSKVWRALPGYGPTNTLLLDNEARKFKDTPANGIVVPEFGSREVQARTPSTLDGLLQYLLQMADAQPSDVRAHMRHTPYSPGAARAPPAPPPAPPAPAAGAAAAAAPPASLASAADALVAAFAGAMRLAATPDAAGEAAGSRAGAAGAGAPPAQAQAQAQAQARVPPGTALRLVCVEGGEFTLGGSYTAAEGGGPCSITVRGPTNTKLRVDAKMDFHRLIEEAEAAGCKLDISHEQST